MQNSNVIDLQARRVKRTEEQRRLRNEQFAQMLLARWSDGGPAGGYTLFNAISTKRSVVR